MKIALLGATGQVGSHLVVKALSRGHFVTGIARDPDKLPQHPRLERAKADITQYSKLSTRLAGHDAVFTAVTFW